MDCEKFDQHVIDELYDELDELTHAALRRHVEGCGRCAGVYAGLKATREVGILPLEEPPDDLEARILDAVAVAQRTTPWHKKALRGLAWAGSHAMRPQLAMAALFFLVIGSSLLLLRARPGTLGPVSVTERGYAAPEPAAADVAATAAAQVAAPPADPVLGGAASAAGPERIAAKAEAADDEKARARGKGSADDARAALAEARAARDGSGCAAAVAKLDAVALGFPGTQAAADAMWDEASCYKQMGDAQKAQQLYLALRSTGYRDRAEQELTASELNTNKMQIANAAPAAAPPPPAAAPAATATAAPAEVVAAAPARAKAALKKADADEPSAANLDKRGPAGAPNPRAPAAPAPAPRVLKPVGF